MSRNILFPLSVIAVFALSACGGTSNQSENNSSAEQSTSVASASETPTSATSSSATESASSSSSSASESPTESAKASASASSSAPAAASNGKGYKVTLTVQTNGTAEFDYNETGKFAKEDISEGFTKTYTVDESAGTLYFSVDADSKSFTATEVACELKYNGKIIASNTSTGRDVVKSTCGVTGDVNTMAEQPFKMK